MRKKQNYGFVTIRDVAKKAEVSTATVSRVINNGNVKYERKKRVLDAIKVLNYVPNESARNLASVTQTKKMIIILPGFEQSFIDIYEGCKDIIKAYGYDFSIDIYKSKDEYEKLINKYSLNSEYAAIIQIGSKYEVSNKLVINWLDDIMSYNKIKANIKFYSEDNILKEFIFDNLIEQNNNLEEIAILPTYMSILKYNMFDKKIVTLENISELSNEKNNIRKFEFDFYALGVSLARISIKKLKKEEITNITLNVGDLYE